MPGTLAADERLRPTGAVQRCPNCEARNDVSAHVAGALVKCAHCAVRFEVRRREPSWPVRARSPEDRASWDELAAVGNPNPLSPTDEAPGAGGEPQGEVDVDVAQISPVPAHAEGPRAGAGGDGVPQKPIPFPQLQGFALHERLGQGGMGEVYRATRLSDCRPVAVKVLSASLAAVPDYVRRFDREAAAMAQLDHPGVVRLLSRGRSGSHCWIAMELIDGVSLRTHAFQFRPSARALARLLAQVAHALAYAHARSVVHRDLKPDNVLVLPDGRTKVLDFGLAGLHSVGAEVLTQSNVAMGTANYMAPEQRKDARRADHRADLYSFGVMTYELLTGELPVGRFQPASRLVPGLDPTWDALVERCLEQDPAARPHSALELAHALDAISGFSPPFDLAPKTRRRVRRSRIWSWLGIGGAIGVVFAIAGLRVVHDHVRPQTLASAVAADRPEARLLLSPARILKRSRR
ncbi:MAG TPA: serine/threonine-protein kinase [Myxococcales bacterium]|nr:serine/threonine-protein kinase [Myxococcales bacterium]